MGRKLKVYWPREQPVVPDVKPALVDPGGNAAAGINPFRPEETLAVATPGEPTWKPEVLEETNRELSGYRMTGNPIYAWALLKRCAETRQPLPREIDRYFITTAEQLLELAKHTNVRPSEIVKVLLGPSGRSTFEDYRLTELHRKIGEEVDRRLADAFSDPADRLGDGIGWVRRPRRSRTEIYDEVAESLHLEAQYVKKVFEADEKLAGEFSFRAQQDAMEAAHKALLDGAEAAHGALQDATVGGAHEFPGAGARGNKERE
jgi:hypothetical protein